MTSHGIDLSSHNKQVDWNKVKTSSTKVDFVMLRAGLGRLASQKDKMFESYYSSAKSAGIPVGAYWYSYALDPEDAKREAAACLEVIKGKSFEYPIWYDVEESSQIALGKEKLTAIITAFLSEVEKAGYWVGLYMSASPMSTLVKSEVLSRYSVWVADTRVRTTPGVSCPYGVWQYSWKGAVAGISGDVDLDRCYVDYPAKIKEKGLNGFSKPSAPSVPAEPEKPVLKSIDEIAKEVIDGKWGNGTYRKTKLTKAGYDYAAVQKRVTEILNSSKLKPVSEIAKEVIAGKWGNGVFRKARLTAAGYDYTAVMKAVNELLRSK